MEYEFTESYFHSKVSHNNNENGIITDSVDVFATYDEMTASIIERADTFQNNGSGWIFLSISYFDIHTNPFQPLAGSSYAKLPNALIGKRSIVNVKNDNDNECFKGAVTSAMYPPKKNPQRLKSLMRENSEKFDWSGIEFPMSLRQIDRFEKQTPISINVFAYESGKGIFPRRICEHRSGRTRINLILVSNDETNHYCWVKNKSRLLSFEKSKKGHKRYFCDYCLNSFTLERELEKHVGWCSKHDAVKLQLPEEGSFIKFKDYGKNNARSFRDLRRF